MLLSGFLAHRLEHRVWKWVYILLVKLNITFYAKSHAQAHLGSAKKSWWNWPPVVKRHSFSEQEQKKLALKRLEEQVEGPQEQFPVAEKVEKDFSFLRTIANWQQSHLCPLLITKKLDIFINQRSDLKWFSLLLFTAAIRRCDWLKLEPGLSVAGNIFETIFWGIVFPLIFAPSWIIFSAWVRSPLAINHLGLSGTTKWS